MKLVSLVVTLAGATVFSEELVADDSVVSLLQHSVRTIRKVEEAVEDPPGPPPPGAAERIAARREQRRAQRAAGRGGPSDLNPEQLERRRARRRARRQAKRAAQAAGQAHFNDGGTCDTCAAKCTAIFDDSSRAV